MNYEPMHIPKLAYVSLAIELRNFQPYLGKDGDETPMIDYLSQFDLMPQLPFFIKFAKRSSTCSNLDVLELGEWSGEAIRNCIISELLEINENLFKFSATNVTGWKFISKIIRNYFLNNTQINFGPIEVMSLTMDIHVKTKIDSNSNAKIQLPRLFHSFEQVLGYPAEIHLDYDLNYSKQGSKLLEITNITQLILHSNSKNIELSNLEDLFSIMFDKAIVFKSPIPKLGLVR